MADHRWRYRRRAAIAAVVLTVASTGCGRGLDATTADPSVAGPETVGTSTAPSSRPPAAAGSTQPDQRTVERSPASVAQRTASGPASLSGPVSPPGSTGGLDAVKPTSWEGTLPDGALAVPAQRATPVRVRIPALGIDALVAGVGVEPDGALALPADVETVAWFAGGPVPGQSGSSVLAAHVDYNGGKGVFFGLASVPDGAAVEVERSDGSKTIFHTVGRARSYAKSSLPIDRLFRRGADPVLTLITCGGTFDAGSRSYEDNIVVTAVPGPVPA